MEEEKFYCSVCGEELSEDEVYEFNGDIYCEACLDDETNTCDRCGERFSNDDLISDEETCVCQSCFEDYYVYCDGCGSIIHRDYSYSLENDEYSYYCDSCYQREAAKLKIHDYSYKPEPIFHGCGSRYIGVEIEADDGGKDEENAENILNIANTYNEENVYIKSDGKLE